MVSFVALYRGETIEDAQVIAVSKAPEIVSGFVQSLTQDGSEDTEACGPTKGVYSIRPTNKHI